MGKRATTREVAELAGVSRTTVSFVLNNAPGMRISEETRQRVLDAAQQLNYHPDANARRMASGQTHVIGFVLRQDPAQALGDYFLPQVLQGISQAANLAGYHTLFEPISPHINTEAYIRLIHERHVDGIILSGPRSDDMEILKLHEEGAHIVLLGQLPGTGIPFVDVDTIGGARTATQHLIDRGHRQIAFIANAGLTYTGSAQRLEGYRMALEAAGIPYDPELVWYGSFTMQSGYDSMLDLLSSGKDPSAVFVASDTVALGVLKAMRQNNLRVPQDIAVCGFDDISIAEFIEPPLTTVRLPAYDLGRGAAELLVRMIEEERVENYGIILETQLVIRDST